MNPKEYSKHKDRSPRDTVFDIRQRLHQAGLSPVVHWIDNPYAGTFSNRVSLYPSICGTNGKGTDEMFCLASAFAELMERIQNNLLSFYRFFPREMYEKYGFFDVPDEKQIPIETVAADKNAILERFFERFGLKHHMQKMMFLKKCAEVFYPGLTDNIACVPYANLTRDSIEYSPHLMVLLLYGSNGMAAGNTMAEAMVQGMSEIFERYVCYEMLKGKTKPPRVPEEYLRQFGVWSIIEELREGGSYDVTVYDGSLGKGYPVALSVICDRRTGCISVRFGSHPEFAVAVERTLTETMQGQERIGNTLGNARTGSLAESNAFHNPVNIFKIGTGVYPTSMFIGQPDWEWKPWAGWEGLDNEGFLRKMLSLTANEGYDILVRDVSHLGFPACHIVIPGMSMIYPEMQLYLRSIYTGFRLKGITGRFPRLTEEDEDALLKFIRFKENSVLENRLDVMFMCPLRGKRMTAEMVGMALAFKKGNYELAYHFCVRMNYVTPPKTDAEKTLQAARQEYLRYRLIGHSHTEAVSLLRLFFLKEAADRIDDEMGDIQTMMASLFPQMNCPDCEHCELAGEECDGPNVLEVMDKIYAAYKGSKVRQEEVLDYLKTLLV